MISTLATACRTKDWPGQVGEYEDFTRHMNHDHSEEATDSSEKGTKLESTNPTKPDPGGASGPHPDEDSSDEDVGASRIPRVTFNISPREASSLDVVGNVSIYFIDALLANADRNLNMYAPELKLLGPLSRACALDWNKFVGAKNKGLET